MLLHLSISKVHTENHSCLSHSSFVRIPIPRAILCYQLMHFVYAQILDHPSTSISFQCLWVVTISRLLLHPRYLRSTASTKNARTRQGFAFLLVLTAATEDEQKGTKNLWPLVVAGGQWHSKFADSRQENDRFLTCTVRPGTVPQGAARLSLGTRVICALYRYHLALQPVWKWYLPSVLAFGAEIQRYPNMSDTDWVSKDTTHCICKWLQSPDQIERIPPILLFAVPGWSRMIQGCLWYKTQGRVVAEDRARGHRYPAVASVQLV